MRRIILCFLLCFPSYIFAQFNQWLPGHDSFNTSQVGVKAEYFIDSKDVTNRFINTYRRGGYIDTEMKDKVLNQLREKNTIGGEFGVDLYYRSAADSIKNRGWYIGLNHTSLLDARFTKDLFHLYFYGNKPFEGRSADLSDLKYNQLEYQQLKGGLYQVKEKGLNRSVYGIGLGYVNGQDFVQIQTGTSSLFTATDATYLTMDLSLESRHADSAHHNLGSFNGSGAALSFYYQFEKKNNFLVTLQLNDFGFIQWNNKSTFVKVDTNYYFDGIEVTNLLDSVYLEVKSVEDYKNSFLKENKNENKTTFLPMLTELSFDKWLLNQRLLAGVHIRYRFGTLQMPVIAAKGRLFFHQSFIGATVQYGGYSAIHAGLEGGLVFGKHWLLQAGTQYLDGFIMGRTRGGQGAFVSLGAQF